MIRIHMGARSVEAVHDTEQAAHSSFKPRGFWYGFGRSWIDWVEANAPGRRKPVLQEVIVDESRLLQIGGTAAFRRFVSMYGDGDAIDWSAVASRYDGIEINPYRWEMRDLDWYYAWDVASGCVWNARAIKGLLPR